MAIAIPIPRGISPFEGRVPSRGGFPIIAGWGHPAFNGCRMMARGLHGEPHAPLET